MIVIEGLQRFEGLSSRPVLTLGIFDGVHLGHQKIIRGVTERARELGGTSCVLTFRPHPLKVLAPSRAPSLLIPEESKISLFDNLGVDLCIIAEFNREFSLWQAEDFVSQILVEKLNISEIFVGFNYAFGRDRDGDANFLKEAGKQYGFKVNIVNPVIVDGLPVSSSRIRELVRKGELEGASRLLGREYSLRGRVERGKGISRDINFPTANIYLENIVLPPEGVYAAWVEYRKRRYKAAIDLKREGKGFIVEAFMFDFGEEIYGEILEVTPVRRIRSRYPFSDRKQARAQIKEDEKIARQILDQDESETLC